MLYLPAEGQFRVAHIMTESIHSMQKRMVTTKTKIQINVKQKTRSCTENEINLRYLIQNWEQKLSFSHRFWSDL